MTRFSVVDFHGWTIDQRIQGQNGHRGKGLTDYHVVDQRGRTKRVFAARRGESAVLGRQRRRAAEDYAEQLNAVHSREVVFPADGSES